MKSTIFVLIALTLLSCGKIKHNIQGNATVTVVTKVEDAALNLAYETYIIDRCVDKFTFDHEIEECVEDSKQLILELDGIKKEKDKNKK